ncbi:stage II sporulation protein M [Firmicutes bacterium CAG:460]|nr:stage II sporulation protein M [Firmicutes bacterium CAG:460]
MVIIMWTSISKKMYVFMLIILIIGIITGIVFVIMLDEATKEILFLNINEFLQNFSNTNINSGLMHLVILSSLLILSIFLVGGPLLIFYMFYNGFSIGFVVSSITYIFGIKGMLYGSIYILISRLVYIIVLIIFNVNLFKIIKCNIDSLVYKKSNKESLSVFYKRSIVFIGIILINDVILYFGGGKLVNLFNFLIK